MRTLKALPELRTFSQRPWGPRLYKYSVREAGMVHGGPGSAPPGFLGPTVSETEWLLYWACARYFLNPLDPRKGPFIGGPPDWTYQQPWIGGRQALFGAVVDFIIWRTPTGRPLGIRMQTEYWHLFRSREVQVNDYNQRGRLMERLDVVDIFDYAILGDPTGQKVMQALKKALGLIELPDPLRAGTARRGARR